MKRFLGILFLLAIITQVEAGVMTISGVYLGKNLYVQNPFAGDMKNFCIQEVFVNDVKVNANIKSSAFEVDLSHLKMNDPVTIKLVHKDDCKPKVINAQVLKQNTAFQFISFSVDKAHIRFSTKGEKPTGKLFIEQFSNNSWSTVRELSVKSASMNSYEVEEMHHSGLNKYRIKYHERDGQVFYSKVVEFTSDIQPVSFYPRRISTKVTLSRPVMFEVLDQNNNVVRKGKGIEIDMSDLKEGIYYLNFDNRTEKVLKK